MKINGLDQIVHHHALNGDDDKVDSAGDRGGGLEARRVLGEELDGDDRDSGCSTVRK